jgi:O-antigen ligase
MFWQHPLFGAGLGAFIEQTAQNGPRPLQIHSTLIWLLAEFGVIGTAVFVWPIVTIVLRELRRHNDIAGYMLLFALIGFATMQMAHELMYQRALWLLLGAGLAVVSQNKVSPAGPYRGELRNA